MPGPAVHHIIAKKCLHELQLQFDLQGNTTAKRFCEEMDTGRVSPIFNFGAQGPDFLFFNMNDWPAGSTVKTVAQTYWEVTQFCEDMVEKIKDAIPQELWDLVADLEAMADTAVERSATLSEISQLVGDVQVNLDALKVVVESKIEEYVTVTFDVFNMLSHPQQDGQKYPDWWWFDTLHVRRSGRFAKELLKQSAANSAERAYAFGYLTHYAADITGHSYVNAVAGGPYRTHAQRHKTIENFHDTWAYSKYVGGELTSSLLGDRYIIDGNKDSLPSSLSNLIIKCIKNTYYESGKPLYGKDITTGDLDNAYKIWLYWFRSSTSGLSLPPPIPYNLTAEIVEAWEKFTDNVGDIADYVGDAFSGDFSFWGFLEALAAIIVGPILLAAAIIDFILGEITTLGAAPIRYFLSLTYEALYNAYMNLREGIVMNGLGFPLSSQLSDFKVRHMMQTMLTDFLGHNAMDLVFARAFPSKKFKMSGFEAESHLIYPLPISANAEIDKSNGFPGNYYSATPSIFIDDTSNAFNATLYKYYKKFVESGAGNTTVTAINQKFSQLDGVVTRGGLGTAVIFCQNLYNEFLTNGSNADIADFSLDSDRGYAFKAWRKVKKMSDLNSTSRNPSVVNCSIEADGKVPNIQTDIIYPDGGAV